MPVKFSRSRLSLSLPGLIPGDLLVGLLYTAIGLLVRALLRAGGLIG